MIGWKLFNAVSSQAENHLAKANYFRVCMMLFSLPVSGMPSNRSRWPLQAYRFSVPLPLPRVYSVIGFVWFLAKNLTL